MDYNTIFLQYGIIIDAFKKELLIRLRACHYSAVSEQRSTLAVNVRYITLVQCKLCGGVD